MPIGVVDFVLEDPRQKILGFDVDRLARFVYACQADLLISRNVTAEKRHGEAALPVFDRRITQALVPTVEYDAAAETGLGIDCGVLGVVHEYSEREVNLRTRQSDSSVRLHRFEHIVNELTILARRNIRGIGVAGDFPEYRMSEPGDLQDHPRSSRNESGSSATALSYSR